MSTCTTPAVARSVTVVSLLSVSPVATLKAFTVPGNAPSVSLPNTSESSPLKSVSSRPAASTARTTRACAPAASPLTELWTNGPSVGAATSRVATTSSVTLDDVAALSPLAETLSSVVWPSA